MRKTDAEYDFQHAQNEKQSYADRDRKRQRRAVDNVLDLRGEDGKIGFGNGYKYTHNKTDDEQSFEFTHFGQARADLFAHRGHGDVRAEVEQRDAEDQRQCRKGEYQRFRR